MRLVTTDPDWSSIASTGESVLFGFATGKAPYRDRSRPNKRCILSTPMWMIGGQRRGQMLDRNLGQNLVQKFRELAALHQMSQDVVRIDVGNCVQPSAE
jgi:hypothetical protein